MSDETPHFHGHGSIYRGSALALQHVDYWLAEQRDEGMIFTVGFVRGDPQVLRPLAGAKHELTLVLEDGRQLHLKLTHARPDGLTWEVEALGTPQ